MKNYRINFHGGSLGDRSDSVTALDDVLESKLNLLNRLGYTITSVSECPLPDLATIREIDAIQRLRNRNRGLSH